MTTTTSTTMTTSIDDFSNDRSGHDDQFCPKIVKIVAILAIFRPFEDFGNMAKIEPTWLDFFGDFTVHIRKHNFAF